jgi:hypothetical protein
VLGVFSRVPSKACFVWVVGCRVCCAGSWLGFSFGLQAFL